MVEHTADLLVRQGRIIDPASKTDAQGDILICRGRIAQSGPDLQAPPGTPVLEARGLVVAPGFIDVHTHLREPGFTHKETIASGTAAAAAGGICAVCAMPNTNPPTSTKVEFQKKLDLAKNRMYCNYAFYFGATADNANELADLKNLEGCCGIKLFAGSTSVNLI